MRFKRFLLFVLAFLILLPTFSRDLEEIKRSGKIRVAFTSDDIRNINYPLAVEFARYLNVELVEVPIQWEQAFMLDGKIPVDLESNPGLKYTPDALQEADIICSTFTILEWRKKLFDFAETLFSAELLLTRRGQDPLENYSDLAGKRITFRSATTFEQHLSEINKRIGGGIELVPIASGPESKRLFKEGAVDGIVLDADEALNFIAENNHAFQIEFPVSDVTKTAWAVEKNNPLKTEVENFFHTIANNGVLDEIFYEKFEIRYTTFVDNIHQTLNYEKVERDLDDILRSKKLVVALRDRNFIYLPDGQKQFMHALAEEFADHLGVGLEIVITPYFSKYWEADDAKVYRDSSYTPEWFTHFDIACEVFAPLDWRSNKIDLIPIYPSEYSVIAKKETAIEDLSDLKDLRCVTGTETVYEDILVDNDLKNYYYEARVNNYLPDVQSGKADYTILYNAFYELSQFPDLEPKIKLGDLNVCWGIRKDQPELERELSQFIASSTENGLIKVLMKSLRGNTLQSPDAFINSYYESFQTGQLPYVNYGADDGLPQEDVFSIFQDRKGYIWFGTNSGAVRYNGREMFVYGENNGLRANSVRDINQDVSGTIYFATTGGLSEFRNDTVVQNYFKGNSFKKIVVDREDNKWLIGDDGVYVLNRRNKELSLGSLFPELPKHVYNLTEDSRSNSVYIATSDGLFLIDLKENSIEKLYEEETFSVFVDVNDSIWISTRTGLYITDKANFRNIVADDPAYNLNKRLNFPVEIISDIKTSSFGSVWLISNARIYQVISTDQKPMLYEEEIGIRNNKILSFFADREDNIWIGFSGGLQRLTNRKGLKNFYPGNINSYIYSIFEDKLGRIWVNSNNGIYYFDKELTQFKPPIGVGNTKYLATLLNNGNVLLANTFGVYEINAGTLDISRYSQFPQLPISIENIFVSSGGEIFLLTGVNGVVYYLSSFYSQPVQVKSRNTSNIYQLTEYNDMILGGNNGSIVYFEGGGFVQLLETNCNVWSLHASDTMLWVGTDCGLGKIQNGKFESLDMSLYDANIVIKSVVAAKNKNYLWLGTNRGFSYYNVNSRENEFRIDTKDGLSGDEITPGGLFLDKNDLLWVGTYHGISNFNIRAKSFRSYAPVCYIEQLLLNGERIEALSGKSFRHNQNNFVFEISALSFTNEKSIEYEFYLRGTGNNYSSYHRGAEFKAYYSNLPPGSYEFIYKAKGKNNLWGYAESYSFTIRKAWYHSWIFRITTVLIILSLAFLFYRMRIRSIEMQKRKLELQVKERTKELEDAKSEIEAQRDLATTQRDQIAMQQQSIMDSIHYAQRIQSAMLPSAKVLDSILPEHFILFKPRDIVSGDFYWAARQEKHIFFTASDCTGHGVPGAFMSMLGIGFLNEIINNVRSIEPHEILNELRIYLINSLHQKGETGEAKDGMDMVMAKYNEEERTLSYSAANNPLYLLRNRKLIPYKGLPVPVAIHDRLIPFVTKKIDILPGDRVYLFSDGYADQFGGPRFKKLMAKGFQKILLETSVQPIKKQGEMLEKAFENWKGESEQIDDVIVLGIEF